MLMNGMIPWQTVVAELTFAEKGTSSAKVILTGFLVVFAVLMLLIGIIKLYSFAIGRALQRADVRKRRKIEMVDVPETPPVPAPRIFAPPEDEDDEVPEEIVAVIAAAVATMYGSPGKARIKSIKKAGGRSAWANAGVMDNTRSF